MNIEEVGIGDGQDDTSLDLNKGVELCVYIVDCDVVDGKVEVQI